MVLLCVSVQVKKGSGSRDLSNSYVLNQRNSGIGINTPLETIHELKSTPRNNKNGNILTEF